MVSSTKRLEDNKDRHMVTQIVSHNTQCRVHIRNKYSIEKALTEWLIHESDFPCVLQYKLKTSC